MTYKSFQSMNQQKLESQENAFLIGLEAKKK